MLSNLEHAQLLAATHNADSIVHAVRHMQRLGLPLNHPRVQFAQLYGMGDHLSLQLVLHGLNVCKYVPFGPLHEVIPYLVRRLHENSGLVGRSAEEVSLCLNAVGCYFSLVPAFTRSHTHTHTLFLFVCSH